MKPATLHEKLLELYAKKEVIDINNINDKNLVSRVITNYLHKKYDSKKVQNLIEDIYMRYNFEEESVEIKRRNQLSDYIDSIVLSRIKDAYKSSQNFDLDLDSLEELEFKALIKQAIIHFGYEILYIPANNAKNIDIIVNRKDIKIAVLAIKGNTESLIGVKTVRQFRNIANYYHCEEALLFTNAYFCSDCFNEAAEIGVKLFDRNKLNVIVKDVINGRQQQEKEYMINGMEVKENTIYLEGEIKFPKTKVQVVYIKYHADEITGFLIFEGRLSNTGKKPAVNLNIEIKIYNRNNDCIYSNNFPINKEKLDSKEEVQFKCVFENIPKADWENLCRYQLKLDYRNTYKDPQI